MHPIPVDRLTSLRFPPPPEIREPAGHPNPKLRRLNLNESHFPPSPNVLAAISEAASYAGFYPDHGCSEFSDLVRAQTGVTRERIAFGNGSGELLTFAATIALEPGDEAVMPAPTFPTCGKGVQLAGADIIDIPVTADGIVDHDAMLAAITERTRLVYLCTPNNPTGGAMSEVALCRMAKEVPDRTLLVVDEAYAEFARATGGPDALDCMAERTGPWIVTRTLSKSYALAGLRIGYALTSDTELRDALWSLRGNFNVNRLALAAACAALRDVDHHRELIATTIAERIRLKSALEDLGLKVFPSDANFITASAQPSGRELEAGLAEHGILVQALSWPDEHGSIRITIGSEDDTSALTSAMRTVLA